MAQDAKQRGLKFIAITDHSKSLTVAHGLDENRLAKQIEDIDRLSEQLNGFTILKGSEVDILEDGRLDFPESILSKLDLVVGAVQSMFRLSRRKQTVRILRAIDSKYFTLWPTPVHAYWRNATPLRWICLRLSKRRGNVVVFLNSIVSRSVWT